jgi:hypothetical protein
LVFETLKWISNSILFIMSTRYIASPGVQISEVDQSLTTRAQAGTTVFITGFAPQGHTDEVINITSVSDFESTFGLPTNEAERYLYHTAKQILTQSPANLAVTRMAYGSGMGAGFANTHAALVYPVIATYTKQVSTVTPLMSTENLAGSHYFFNGVTTITLSTDVTTMSPVYTNGYSNLSATIETPTVNILTSYIETASTKALPYELANNFIIGQPISILLNEEEYHSLVTNDVNWSSKYSSTSGNNTNYLKNAGIVIVNSSKTTINDKYEGYYVGLADNSNNNPATNFDALTGAKTVTSGTSAIQTWTNIPASRLSFKLSSTSIEGGTSISQAIEQFPLLSDFGSSTYNDSLTLMLFKIRTSTYGQDTIKLDYIIQEGHTGSLYSGRTQNNQKGGAPVSFSLEKITNLESSDIKMIVNPWITNSNNWLDGSGNVVKTVRLNPEAKNIYAVGTFVQSQDVGQELGNVPDKLRRVLNRLDDLDTELDLFAEAGLGTIYAGARSRERIYQTINSDYSGLYFDTTQPVPATELTALFNQDITTFSSVLKDDYVSIVSQMATFAEKTRKDHMFIADPLRYIFLNGPDGPNVKATKKSGYNFSTDIFWALKNLYGNIVTSYGATYGNWAKVSGTDSNNYVWIPMSGFVAADIALSSATNYPWSAPAGFARGTLTGIVDIAINPTQKHRDLLYKININPVAYFPGDGYVIFGQKTLFNKPSAFDRINVRRLFLTLEKVVQRLLRYYVFEGNTYTTRLRLVNSLLPLFNQAKNSDGLYDFRIICDERNNTPDVIDDNTLKIAIYIQPVRTAEFILADFVATRSGSDFNEITS